jgi:hypothetical protein
MAKPADESNDVLSGSISGPRIDAPVSSAVASGAELLAYRELDDASA